MSRAVAVAVAVVRSDAADGPVLAGVIGWGFVLLYVAAHYAASI